MLGAFKRWFIAQGVVAFKDFITQLGMCMHANCLNRAHGCNNMQHAKEPMYNQLQNDWHSCLKKKRNCGGILETFFCGKLKKYEGNLIFNLCKFAVRGKKNNVIFFTPRTKT